MKHRTLAVAALALLLAGALLPGWSHAAEPTGPSTPAAPASCLASNSIPAALPLLTPWSAPLALDSAACSTTCSDTVCQGQPFFSPCPASSGPPLFCTPTIYCAAPVGGRRCVCQPGP